MAIKKEELRMGNYFMYGELCIVNVIPMGNQVEAYHNNGKNQCWLPYESIEPIPLTIEILEQCGFEISDGDYTIRLPLTKPCFIYIETDQKWIEDGKIPCGIKSYDELEGHTDFHYFKPIKYLHQLQNLFYTLSGEELTINLQSKSK